MNSAQAGKILERGLGRGKNFARLLSRKAGLGWDIARAKRGRTKSNICVRILFKKGSRFVQ